jgi:hypothetical protein
MSDVREHAPVWFAEMVMPTGCDDAVSICPDRETDLLLIDPRPCQLCGLTIDRHEMVDHGDGPLFFCADISPDEMTLPELKRRSELRRQEEVAAMVKQWELADPRDRWKHTGEPAPPPEVRNGPADPLPRREPKPYRTPQETADAFLYLVSLGEPERLDAWLAARPQDVPSLLELLESKS